MQIYQTIDSWVRAWEVDEAHPMPAISCASVTLRIDGQVIGRGQVVHPDIHPMCIAQATRSAIAQARAWVRGQAGGEPDDGQWSGIASRIVLSIELADRIVPMRESELGLPGLGLSPGVHGLVMHLGQRPEVMTPDEMITLGFSTEQAAYSMATRLSGDGAMALASVGELIGQEYRFGRIEPVWIAQQEPGKGGVFLDRGGRVIKDSSVGVRSVRDMGERIAEYLIAQQWPGSERYGMVGTRDVISGRASPEVAPVYEQALVAYALLRYGDGGHGSLQTRARQQGLRILEDLAIVQPGEQEPWGLDDGGIGAAACAIAQSHEEPGSYPEEYLSMQSRCVKAVGDLYSPSGGFSSIVPGGARGLIAWALVKVNDKDAEHAVRAVFRDTPPGQLVGQMPFLGWAELELAHGKETVPASGALSQMRTRMWDHQLTKPDLDWRDRDFIGAVVFTGGSSSLPTSGNLRPIAMACSMLGDPRLIPGTIADREVAIEIGRVASTMRFVDQLVMSDASGFVSRTPERCIGGIRSSLWEWKVSPASSAIALLAAIEFERSIKAIAARPMPDQQP